MFHFFKKFFKNYTIYTDGSCIVKQKIKGKENLGIGGCSCVILQDDIIIKEISQGFRVSNSSRMELMAVILALKSIPKYSSVDLYIDSFMVIDGMKGINKPNKNLDLWKEIHKLKKNLNIKYHHVKGHNGNKYNEICDELAKKATENEENLKEDKPYKNKKLKVKKTF